VKMTDLLIKEAKAMKNDNWQTPKVLRAVATTLPKLPHSTTPRKIRE